MTGEIVDWDAWEVDEPTPEFVERVMLATRAGGVGSAIDERRRRALLGRTPTAYGSFRATMVLAAAAIVGVSLAGLAMVAHEARRGGPAPKSGTTAGHSLGPDQIAQRGAESVARSEGEERAAAPATSTIIDRKLRDQVRAKLLPVLHAHGVERDPHTGFTVPSGSGPSQNLTREYIQARMREDFFPLARSCYEAALARIPGLRGQIILDFVIVGDAKVGGIVDQAAVQEKSDIADPEFVSCMRESMMSMVFAPPANDGWVTVVYPIQFAPDGEPSKDE